MTWLRRLWKRAVCKASNHELDWLMVHAGGVRQCKHCLVLMPEPRRTIGQTHPDSGD